MSEPRQAPDELELKKRARRRLVGAVAFATFAAVVLPMVMDETPPPTARDIDLRIPGQDQVSSSPLTGAKVPSGTGAKTASPAAAPEAPIANPPPATASVTAPPTVAKAATATPPAKAEAPPLKPAAKPVPAPAVESPKAPVTPPPAARNEAAADSGRAQAILDAQSTPAANGAHVILIGAFANPANVRNLQTKLGQLGIKTYTENVESPQGRKTRVRAGPFANREAADKALDKMKRIGVSGVVAPKP